MLQTILVNNKYEHFNKVSSFSLHDITFVKKTYENKPNFNHW